MHLVAYAKFRYGPAQIWYDAMNVPANPSHFDYGFKLKRDVCCLGSLKKKKKTGGCCKGLIRVTDRYPLFFQRNAEGILISLFFFQSLF